MESRRITRPKKLILECLKKTEGRHVTAEEVADSLKKAGTPVGKATVYRYLAELEAKKHVRRYRIAENGPSCYQYLGEESLCNKHYHLLCEKCGDIVHFEYSELNDFFNRMNEEMDFVVHPTKAVFYGTCKICVTKNSEETLLDEHR